MQRRPSRFVVASLSVLCCGGAALARSDYDLIVIEPTGATPLTETGIGDVSNLGRVVGSTHDNGQFRWFEWTESGGFSWLPVLFQSPTNPYPSVGRLNDQGDRLFGNVLMKADGSFVDIPYVDGSLGLPSMKDLNDSLTLVGNGPNGTSSQILIWDPILGSRTLPIPGAMTLLRVSESGHAVGYVKNGLTSSRAFVADVATGAWTDLGDILTPGMVSFTKSEAVDVNEHGVVTGQGTVLGGTAIRAYVWSPSQGLTFLPALESGFEAYVVPAAIDDAGQVVGGALTSSGYRAFLWNPQTGLHDLNDLVASTSFTLRAATDISETGVIVGSGFHGANWGPARGFILDPESAWQYLGNSKPGTFGAPYLHGSGDLAAGTTGSLILEQAAASVPAMMFVALNASPTPFLGGLLVPFPPQLAVPLTTSAAGTTGFSFPVPSGLSGVAVVFQCAVADPTATQGVALSNATRAEFP